MNPNKNNKDNQKSMEPEAYHKYLLSGCYAEGEEGFRNARTMFRRAENLGLCVQNRQRDVLSLSGDCAHAHWILIPCNMCTIWLASSTAFVLD